MSYFIEERTETVKIDRTIIENDAREEEIMSKSCIIAPDMEVAKQVLEALRRRNNSFKHHHMKTNTITLLMAGGLLGLPVVHAQEAAAQPTPPPAQDTPVAQPAPAEAPR